MQLNPIDRYFLGFVLAVGAALGLLLVRAPEIANAAMPPYLWLLAMMLGFETVAFLKNRGAPGTMVSMGVRVLGFAGGMILMALIPYLAGSPARLF